VLWAETMTKEVGQPLWITYRQAETLHTHVRHGERGSLVVYADRILRTEVDGVGEEQETEILRKPMGTPLNLYSTPSSTSRSNREAGPHITFQALLNWRRLRPTASDSKRDSAPITASSCVRIILEHS